MAAGSDLLDEVFFNTEVDEKVVSDLVGSLESQLAASGHHTSEVRAQGAGNHVASSGVGGNASVQTESKMGLAQEMAKAAGAGVQGGVINNNARSQGSALDATVITSSSAGSEAPGALSQAKSVVISAMATPVPNHGAGSGKIGTSTVQTLNGSNVVMNSHTSGSAGTFAGTTGSGTTAPAAATVVNNGPGSVVKGNVNSTVVPAAPNTVIQTPFLNTPNVSSTVISSQPAAAASNSSPSSAAVAGSGVALQSPLLNSQPAPGLTGGIALGAGAPVIKTEAPKTIIQTPQQPLTASNQPNTTNMVLGQTMQAALHNVVAPNSGGLPPQPPATPAGIGKAVVSTVAQSIPRTPAAAAAVAGGIRTTMAPPVLAPRLPQPPQTQPNIQNFQLPPGMVLVRSDSGQFLMIHQQTLAQMQAQAQAQSQSQNAMAPRPATPTSAPSVQISTVQVQFKFVKFPQSQIVLGSAPQTAALGTSAAVQPGTSPRPVQGAGTSSTTATEIMENVKKCKNFLSTLIKLASSGKQSTETAANVKELVQNLLDGKMEAEDFTSRLYRELNSSPQPYLVPFLKRSLPALRQLTPDSAAFIQQSQLQQPTTQATTALTAVVLGSTVQRTAGKATATVTSTLQQPVISLAQPTSQAGKQGQPTSLVIQQAPQPGARPPQVTLTQPPMVTLRPPQNRIMLTTQHQVQLKPLQAVPLMKPTVLPGTKAPPSFSAQAAVAQKNKLKEAGGGSFRDDDDINDVASMAGVNLSEESARILATNSELVGTLTRSCKDEAFLFSAPLNRRILEIGKKYGITEIHPDVVNYMSHATQHRLQNLVEKASEIAQQRNISYKDDERYEQVSDVRAQLKFFEQLDQIEKQRKDEQEREILMRAAKASAFISSLLLSWLH
nr:PREDICTED: transcription initiation factor TFIID subunit 4 [Latimeria chalumnae]|eukprot:XP_014344201.1 PREDICTED: transcription initiation factor TFIID subunit 4 [Latimeria chalumnae]